MRVRRVTLRRASRCAFARQELPPRHNSYVQFLEFGHVGVEVRAPYLYLFANLIYEEANQRVRVIQCHWRKRSHRGKVGVKDAGAEAPDSLLISMYCPEYEFIFKLVPVRISPCSKIQRSCKFIKHVFPARTWHPSCSSRPVCSRRFLICPFLVSPGGQPLNPSTWLHLCDLLGPSDLLTQVSYEP